MKDKERKKLTGKDAELNRRQKRKKKKCTRGEPKREEIKEERKAKERILIGRIQE